MDRHSTIVSWYATRVFRDVDKVRLAYHTTVIGNGRICRSIPGKSSLRIICVLFRAQDYSHNVWKFVGELVSIKRDNNSVTEGMGARQNEKACIINVVTVFAVGVCTRVCVCSSTPRRRYRRLISGFRGVVRVAYYARTTRL